MGQPIMNTEPGAYTLKWEKEQLSIRFERFTESKQGLSAELTVKSLVPETPQHLHQARLNLTSTRARKELAGFLAERAPDVEWISLLEQACSLTLARYRQGEPVKEIWTYDDIQPPKYLLSPILAEGQPNFIYGPGGSGKSYLGLLLGVCVQLPWRDNPFGFATHEHTANMLYLDWETSESEIKWRLKCLQRGLNLPDFGIRYCRCAMPLSQDIEAISQKITEASSRLVIIDSLAAACGGDLNMPEPALQFFRALRSLNVTSLIIAHTPRESGNGEKQIFGSVFFWNYGRSIWEVRPEHEVGADSLLVGLFHRKANMSKLHEPMGFLLRFDTGTTTVERVDSELRQSSLSGALPLADQIEGLLGQSGALSVSEIARELGKGEDSIRRTLNRHKGSKFDKTGDRWDILTGHLGGTGSINTPSLSCPAKVV